MSVAMLLGVNIDHVATLRQARRARYPDPVHAALAAEQAGADSITLHLREDRRHIQDQDVLALRGLLQTRMNLELAVTDEMLAIAAALRPSDCCLVPERRLEITTSEKLREPAAHPVADEDPGDQDQQRGEQPRPEADRQIDEGVLGVADRRHLIIHRGASPAPRGEV